MRLLLALIVVGALVSTLYAEHQPSAQHQHGQTPTSQAPTSQAPVSEGTAVTAPTSPAPRRATMQELHEMGGVPRGWKFSLPSGGDVARGRELFVNLECYKCHNVQGEAFPEVTGDAKYVGPDLSGMGGHHPAEYFAESVLSPNAVIITSQGYTGPDGLSIMPSFADSVSVGELLDLVAYMKSLTDGGNHDHHHAGPRGEAVAGPYRVRLVYAGGGHQHDHHQGHDHRAASKTSGHLMAFITDRESDEPLPYLPVTAMIQGAGKAARTIQLVPMVGGRGFHYGADVSLPADTRKVTLAIGATTMAVMGASAERYKKPTSAVFDWQPDSK